MVAKMFNGVFWRHLEKAPIEIQRRPSAKSERVTVVLAPVRSRVPLPQLAPEARQGWRLWKPAPSFINFSLAEADFGI